MQINDVMTELAERLRSQYLLLDGTSGTFASAPDHNRLSVTGDIDIRCRVAADDWTPGVNARLVAKRASASQVSYDFALTSSGGLFFAWSENGSTIQDEFSTVALGFTNGTTHSVRVTLDVDNGSSQHVITFFTSDDGEKTWSQLGAVFTRAGTTSIFDSNSEIRIGDLEQVASPFTGKVFQVEIRDGIDGTVVASPRFSDGSEWQPGDMSSRDDQDNVWTLQGNAVIIEEGITGLRVYDHLADNAQIPAAIVGFPESYDFDATFNRGVDMVPIPVHVLVGRITDRSSKDNLSVFVDGSGPSSIKQLLESGTYDAFTTLRVADVTFETITLAGVELLAATFQVDVWGSGN